MTRMKRSDGLTKIPAPGREKAKGRGTDKKRSRGSDDPVQVITDKYIGQINQLLESKEEELLEL